MSRPWVKRPQSFEDQMRRVETYDLPDGRRVTFASDYVDAVGIEEAMRREGIEASGGVERVPVWQSGRKIGTLPASFDPDRIKSTSFFYDARPGDFTRRDGGWEATRMLGPGDLDAVPGFRWDRQ